MEVFDKYSVTPFSFREFGETNFDLPFSLGAPGDIRVDSVEGLLRPEYFSIWKKFLSSDSLERFEQAKFALVHHFRSGYVVGKDEEDSKDLLHKAFLCLRVVKPTRAPFSVVQYRRTKEESIDVFSALWPVDIPMNLPESEVLNQINVRDLQQLRRFWPSFRRLMDSGPGHVRRAARCYETGYAELRAVDLQFITWVMGIEALYAEGEEPSAIDVIKKRIFQFVGADTDIYDEFEHRSLYAPNPVLVKDVVEKMFELRDRVIHGAGAPKSWFDAPMRSAISGGHLTLPDVLREAASFILRTGIKKRLLSTADSD